MLLDPSPFGPFVTLELFKLLWPFIGELLVTGVGEELVANLVISFINKTIHFKPIR